MGRKPAGREQSMREWGVDGEDLPVVGWGWGHFCLPASLSSPRLPTSDDSVDFRRPLNNFFMPEVQ